MYKILQKQVLSDVTKLMVVEAPQIARKAKAGQFVIVITHERGERIPCEGSRPSVTAKRMIRI